MKCSPSWMSYLICKSTNSKTNVVSASSVLLCFPQLIIDSGTTDHINFSTNLLVNNSENTILLSIIMPENILQLHLLALYLWILLSLWKKVLHMASCKMDLMSVSRVMRDLNYLVNSHERSQLFSKYFSLVGLFCNTWWWGQRLIWINNKMGFIIWLQWRHRDSKSVLQ